MCGERSLSVKWQNHALDRKEYAKPPGGSKIVGVPNSESQCVCSTRGGQGRCMADMDQEA